MAGSSVVVGQRRSGRPARSGTGSPRPACAANRAVMPARAADQQHHRVAVEPDRGRLGGAVTGRARRRCCRAGPDPPRSAAARAGCRGVAQDDRLAVGARRVPRRARRRLSSGVAPAACSTTRATVVGVLACDAVRKKPRSPSAAARAASDGDSDGAAPRGRRLVRGEGVRRHGGSSAYQRVEEDDAVGGLQARRHLGRREPSWSQAPGARQFARPGPVPSSPSADAAGTRARPVPRRRSSPVRSASGAGGSSRCRGDDDRRVGRRPRPVWVVAGSVIASSAAASSVRTGASARCPGCR